MNRDRLDSDRIQRLTLPPGAGQAFFWDTEAPRLAVRVTAGSKSFIFESKLSRRTIRLTIGDTRAWTVGKARAEARRLETLIDQRYRPPPREDRAERRR